jgi:curved DNA-binding protein CbpA
MEMTAANGSPPSSGSSSPTTDLPDYYEILGVDIWSTSEEIKQAYRGLRTEFFNTDASKYRALQAAFGILADTEARFKYDKAYREERGITPPPPLKASVSEVTRVEDRIQAFEAKSQHSPRRTPALALETLPAQASEVENTEDSSCTELPEVQEPKPTPTDVEPNFWLKQYSVDRSATAMIGKRPYPSFIPVPVAYRGIRQTIPTYVGTIAKNARP